MHRSGSSPSPSDTRFLRLLRGEITSAQYVALLRAKAQANVKRIRKDRTT